MSKTIYIDPLDTLFFKDGKPFSMGEETWADPLFPPMPSVVYGALRTTFAYQQTVKNLSLSFEKAVEDSGRLTIRNIYLVQGEDMPLFPFPLDLLKFHKKQQGRDLFYLQKIEYPDVLKASSNLTPQILVAREDLKAEKTVDVAETAKLNKYGLEEYLQAGPAEEITLIDLLKSVISEPKVGIGRDNFSRTTSGESTGMLYRVGMQRLTPWTETNQIRIAVEFDGIELEDQDIIKLGAEGKAASYQTAESYNPAVKIEPWEEMKFYLATPAIFRNGWCPDWLAKKNFNGINVELLACAVGKPVYVGGFDVKNQQPKKMYKAVPAGSVYYFKTDRPEAFINELQQLNALSDDNDHNGEWYENFSQQGFGKFYVANIQQ